MFDRKSPQKNGYMLTGSFARRGYDWWWHSFTGRSVRTGEERSFFVEFFLCNPALAKAQPTFGQLPENLKNGIPPSYCMVKAGCWGADARQLHRFFSLRDCSIRARAPFSVAAGDCFVSDTELRGSVCVSAADAAAHPEWMCAAGAMQWDLRLDKRIAFDVGYGTSAPLRALKAFEMYWHAAGMKTALRGTVTLDGELYAVEPGTSFGYADKNWGRGFTSPWVWLSSCDLTSRLSGRRLENSAFDIGGGRPKIYFAALERKLLGAFYYEGAEYEFNFSKFWTGSKTAFSCEETPAEIVWQVTQQNRTAEMVTEVRCRKADMLLVNYEAPDGTKRHNRLWNGGTGRGRIRLYAKHAGQKTLIDDIDAAHVGCEFGEYDPA